MIGLCVSVLLFIGLNWIEFRRPVTCWDCDSGYGLPFIFWREGGFLHDRRFIWTGIIENLVFVIGFGAAVTWIVALIRRKPVLQY